jgi:hypothetical protein
MIVQMREDAVRIVQVEDVDDPNGRTPPPIWIVVVVVLAGVGAAWFLVNQRSSDVESGLSSTTTSTVTSLEDVAESTPPAISPEVASETRVERPVAPAVITVGVLGLGPGDVAGDVVLSSPHNLPDTSLWVLRPGGSIVSRIDVPITPGVYPYPLLMTDGRIVFAHYGFGYLLDADLVDRAVQLASTRFVIPGGTPGSVWFVGHRTLQSGGPFVQWVASVDVENGTVGDPIDVTDGRWWPVAGFGDGLIVNPIDEETYGRFAYWSPTDGLAPLGLRDPDNESVVAASGDLLVVASSDRVSVVDTATGDYLNSYTFDFGEGIGSACLSPDQRHVVVVGSNGRAFLGNTISGELFVDYPAIQVSHGVGWTSDDQLVYLAVSENGRSLVVQDLSPFGSDSHEIALLSGTQDWWLAASGTMC